MAHKKIIDSVKKQGQVAIKDLDEFLRFIINESDMRTFDANYISILIPMQFDIDIRCCGGKDNSWTEAILYDNTGKEVVSTEPCDGFTGCWELKDEDANTVYRAHVMTKPNLN